uniref:receptor kinase-like protein Xa21 n=1 Tax=Erigeron canadensis TaxID=72917 RepID=UPI001CB8EF63|nr:receptor kinase-like protein Xa21 [Erigeron canadensis]
MSQNNLSGEIPKSLEALMHLTYLNLSFNSLQGEIPSGGNFSNFSASSFMHNKDLCGAPNLEVLSCRRKLHESRDLSFLKYILPIIASTIGLAVAVCLLKTRRKRTQTNVEPLSLHEWTRVSYYELVKATESFDESNLIGNGAYGSVFKGKLSNGVDVAVKVFNMPSECAVKSFDVECEVQRNIRHRNLVRIISSCTNLDFRGLVIEYMPNGSLEQWLYAHNNHMSLVQRLQVMIDVASALEYLHHGQSTPIFHCDLKPSNILLDENMHAHVCGFGIAKLFGEDEVMLRTATLGTIGYMAPEYGMEGVVSTGSDVYSFGILVLETFTGKKPTEEMFSGEVSLRGWVLEAAVVGNIHMCGCVWLFSYKKKESIYIYSSYDMNI